MSILIKGTSKHFVESIYSTEAVKTEVFFTYLKRIITKDDHHQKTPKILESSLLKIFSSIL